jgi:hypothetical protein
MEAMQVLEQKISKLITLIKELKTENSELRSQNVLLDKKNQEMAKVIETMELSLLSNKEANREDAEVTKLAVDELIKSIDSLVEPE